MDKVATSGFLQTRPTTSQIIGVIVKYNSEIWSSILQTDITAILLNLWTWWCNEMFTMRTDLFWLYSLNQFISFSVWCKAAIRVAEYSSISTAPIRSKLRNCTNRTCYVSFGFRNRTCWTNRYNTFYYSGSKQFCHSRQYKPVRNNIQRTAVDKNRGLTFKRHNVICFI
jgi:hypothetical protein